MRPCPERGEADLAGFLADVPIRAAEVAVDRPVPHQKEIQVVLEEHSRERASLAELVPALPDKSFGKNQILVMVQPVEAVARVHHLNAGRLVFSDPCNERGIVQIAERKEAGSDTGLLTQIREHNTVLARAVCVCCFFPDCRCADLRKSVSCEVLHFVSADQLLDVRHGVEPVCVSAGLLAAQILFHTRTAFLFS